MRQLGIQGARRDGRHRTTIASEADARPADLVERTFKASAPNKLWLADLTYVRTWSGFVYVAFIIDCFARKIVGWQASRSLRTDLCLDALEQAIWARKDDGLDELVHHSDRGVLRTRHRKGIGHPRQPGGALGRAWHLPSPDTTTTREFVQTIFQEVGKPHASRRRRRSCCAPSACSIAPCAKRSRCSTSSRSHLSWITRGSRGRSGITQRRLGRPSGRRCGGIAMSGRRRDKGATELPFKPSGE